MLSTESRPKASAPKAPRAIRKDSLAPSLDALGGRRGAEGREAARRMRACPYSRLQRVLGHPPLPVLSTPFRSGPATCRLVIFPTPAGLARYVSK